MKTIGENVEAGREDYHSTFEENGDTIKLGTLAPFDKLKIKPTQWGSIFNDTQPRPRGLYYSNARINGEKSRIRRPREIGGPTDLKTKEISYLRSLNSLSNFLTLDILSVCRRMQWGMAHEAWS